MTTPTLSIVIPVFNAETTLAEQLLALQDTIDDDMEVLIVDNRSTDRSRELARTVADSDTRFRCVDASERQGEPHARNVGVESARATAIAFCDADDVVTASWPHAMRRALQQFSYVTGPIELDRLNPPWLAGFRGRKSFIQIPTTANGIPFAHGCSFGVRAETVRLIGGFDENVLIGCDIDFAIRAHRAGVELGWAPEAVIHYRHRTTSRQRWRQAIAFGRAAHHLHLLAGADDRLRIRVRRQARRVGWLVRSVPGTVRRDHRAQWVWTLALVIGEVRGGGA